MDENATILETIKKRFSEATRSYDSHARVQDEASSHLASEIFKIAKKHNLKTCLEVGAGTGLLTRRLHESGVFRELTVTDLSETMLRVNKKLLSNAENVQFHQCDLHQIDLEKTYDVIAGNMCFQWISDVESVFQNLVRYLNPGGVLAISVPVAGSFEEWEQASRKANVPFTANPLYGKEDWARFLSEADVMVTVSDFQTTSVFEKIQTFFHSLKYIGAETATHEKPLNPLEMRSLLRVSPEPFHITWKIALLTGVKP